MLLAYALFQQASIRTFTFGNFNALRKSLECITLVFIRDQAETFLSPPFRSGRFLHDHTRARDLPFPRYCLRDLHRPINRLFDFGHEQTQVLALTVCALYLPVYVGRTHRSIRDGGWRWAELA